MRVFTAALATETNTFAPLPTGLASFREAGFHPAGMHPDHPTFFAAPLWAAPGVSYYRDIRPIIEDKCVACHAQGSVAFSFEDPERAYDFRAAIVGAVAARRMPPPWWFTPVNEPSFFAWAGGEVGRFAPHARGRGFELKLALARAAIRGIEAIHEACPGARILNVDPVCRVVPGSRARAAREHARRFNDEWVFEFWDLVSGRLRPALGGSPAHLDVPGINYYWTNQWELGREGVPLGDDDPRRVPLADLVRTVWRRT